MATRLSLLGSAAVTADGTEQALPVDRRGCLLAYLAVEGGWVSRERLALLFWPDSDETTAKRNLRQLVLRVRRLALGDDIEVTPDAVRWPVECDVAEFRSALANGDGPRAVAVYGGQLLDGFIVHDVGGFDAWLEGERDRLRLAFQDAALAHANEALADGRFAEAARLLEPLHDADPLAEDVLAAYVRVLYLAGRRDAALAAYARFERDLEQELGLEPLEGTKQLADLVRRGERIEVTRPRKREAQQVSLAPSKLAGRDEARQGLLRAETPVVLLRGEPGIGKTSLLAEAFPDALHARATEGLEKLPYHPLVELVRRRPDLADGLGPYREDLARLAPDVAPDVTPAPVDAGAVKGRVAEALARFVTAAGGVLVVDDLQWADPATLETIIYLAGQGSRVHGAYRTAEVSPELSRALAALRGARRLTEVDIEPIDEEAVRTLMADLMDRSEGPPAFSRRMWRHTGGNPMFVLETLRSLFESGRLRRDEHGWHTDVDEVTIDYSELSVPDAIGDVIGRRLEHLSGEAARLLEALALARTSLGPATLAAVTGLSASAVATALDEVQASGFLVADAFRHDLLRQVLDARVPPARRRLLHGLIAEALTGSADPALLAEHWLAAGERARAREAWLVKATELRGRGLQPAAIEMLASAVSRLPAGDDNAWLRLTLADALRESGRAEDAIDQVRAVGLMETMPPALRMKLSLASAWLEFHSGRIQSASEALEDARRLAPNLPPDDELSFDLAMLGASIAKEERRIRDAHALLEPALVTLRGRPPSVRLIQFLVSRAALLDDEGRHDEALELHHEALALAGALGSRYYQVEGTINLVYCLTDLGRLDEAIEAAEAVLDFGDYDSVPLLRNNLAAVLMEAGRVSEALEHYEMLLSLASMPHLSLIAAGRSAECLSRLGRQDEARRRIDEGLGSVEGDSFPLAVASLACSAIAYGTRPQVERLARLTRGFAVDMLPPYLIERLAAAVGSSDAAGAVPDAWWRDLPSVTASR